MASFGQGQESFGRLALQAASARELLELEHARDRAKDFLPLDSLTGRVAIRALCGERPFSVKGVEETGASGRTVTLRLKGLSGEKRLFLEELFSLEKQKSRFPKQNNPDPALPTRIQGELANRGDRSAAERVSAAALPQRSVHRPVTAGPASGGAARARDSPPRPGR